MANMDRYDAELDALYAAIIGREPFRYQAGADPLYQAYASQSMENGRRAMWDSMGRAAALTGGYGSSYAQALGQQQYDEYLRRLGEAIPEFYGLAWQQYQAQGAALQDAYDRSAARRAAAYEQQRDEANLAFRREQESYQQSKDRYEQLYQLISLTGYEPDEEELGRAGMSHQQAEALWKVWESKQPQPSSGGGYTGSSSGDRRKREKSLKSIRSLKSGSSGGTVSGTNTRGGGGSSSGTVTMVK